MLLLFLTVSFALLGLSSGARYEEVCYGRDFRIPFDYTPPLYGGKLYLTPTNGGTRRILMDNGEAKDPRIKGSFGSVRLTDLRQIDDGWISISYHDNRLHNVIRLSILDCADEVRRVYGSRYYFDVSRNIEFLEFTPLGSGDEPKVLWNRTDPQTNKGGRGQMKRNYWEIMSVTQADSGHYNLRRKDNSLVSRKLLTVEENIRNIETKVNERLLIDTPFSTDLYTVTFTPDGETDTETLVKGGRLMTTDYWYSGPFHGRILFSHSDITINPVESTDSGTFYFSDQQGNLAQTVEVVVKPEVTPTTVYVGIIVGVVLAVIVCCCCVRKCCCKKSSQKRDESPPAAHFHDHNQPAGPSYTAACAPVYSYQPMNVVPATTSTGPSVYNPVNIQVNTPQPEVVAPVGQRDAPAPSVGSDFLSLDSEPTFELKGPIFSAPPLSSGSNFCDVYTSDKLNFP